MFSYPFAGCNRKPIRPILTDIDNFKQINDTFSRAVGDESLRAMANSLFAAVDRALHATKQSGRNRVVAAQGGIRQENP